MRRITIAALACAAVLPVSTAEGHVIQLRTSAEAASTAIERCAGRTYTVIDYRKYAKRVYKRKRVSQKAHRLMRDMHICQRNGWKARKAVGRHHDRYKRDRAALIRQRSCNNSNPTACAYLAAAYHGIDAGWLIACAKSEGGLGPSDYDRPNMSGSGATGNWQFMSGTFWGYVGRSGAPKPHIYLSSEDQAYTAAYMFKIGESGQWTGAGC
jgi:hypothetical protein